MAYSYAVDQVNQINIEYAQQLQQMQQQRNWMALLQIQVVRNYDHLKYLVGVEVN